MGAEGPAEVRKVLETTVERNISDLRPALAEKVTTSCHAFLHQLGGKRSALLHHHGLNIARGYIQ